MGQFPSLYIDCLFSALVSKKTPPSVELFCRYGCLTNQVNQEKPAIAGGNLLTRVEYTVDVRRSPDLPVN